MRHGLWVEDLQRYGIQCIEVDEYEDVDEILHAVEKRLAGRSVFVSGSFPDAVSDDQRRYIEAVAREVGRVIAEQEKRLVSGFGLVVGSAALAGALGVILKEHAPNLEKSLLMRPFPQEPPAGTDMAAFRRRYRDGMIQQAGLCVFIGGMKTGSGRALAEADGVMEEFESAKRIDRTVVPIGASGGAAARIWDRLNKVGALPAGIAKADFDRLNDPAEPPAEIAKIVEKAIKAIDDPPSGPRSRKRS